MLVNNVRYLNIDTLYTIVTEYANDPKYINEKFGRNLAQLLGHVEVSFELEDVSMYEYIFLKMYASSITKLTNIGVRYEYAEENYNEIYNSFYKLSVLTNVINEDLVYNKENKMNMLMNYSPSGLVIGRCNVTFTGYNLQSLVGLNPRDFFIEASDRKCIIYNEDPSKNKMDLAYKNTMYKDDQLDNYFIKKLISNFYKFIADKVSYIDILSDTASAKKFLSVENNTTTFKNMRNHFVYCDFIEDDNETFKNSLNTYHLLGIPKNRTLTETKFEITINSDFGVFFEFMNLLPYDRFIDISSFLEASNKSVDDKYIPLCPEIIKENFNNRFNGRISEIINKIKEKYHDSNNLLKSLETTMNYVPFTFSILISLDDIDKYIHKYIINEIDDDALKVTTKDIMKKIMKTSLWIYSKM